MDVVYRRCCGLDVHKKMLVACLLSLDEQGQRHKEIRVFTTMTHELLALADWLSAADCTHVAMESTGVYWKPIFALLEGQFAVILANAQHLKAVPGHKTDIKLRHDVASIAVEQEQSRLDLVYCHQSPTRPREQSNPPV